MNRNFGHRPRPEQCSTPNASIHPQAITILMGGISTITVQFRIIHHVCIILFPCFPLSIIQYLVYINVLFSIKSIFCILYYPSWLFTFHYLWSIIHDPLLFSMIDYPFSGIYFPLYIVHMYFPYHPLPSIYYPLFRTFIFHCIKHVLLYGFYCRLNIIHCLFSIDCFHYPFSIIHCLVSTYFPLPMLYYLLSIIYFRFLSMIHYLQSINHCVFSIIYFH